jgi:hypothetical protein
LWNQLIERSGKVLEVCACVVKTRTENLVNQGGASNAVTRLNQTDFELLT